MEKGRRWAESEDAFLKENLGRLSYSEIGSAIGRTGGSVGARTSLLGLAGTFSPPRRGGIHEDRLSPETLCWRCKRAGSLSFHEKPCAWVLEEKPVENWTATETVLGYRVLTCPRFIGRKEK